MIAHALISRTKKIDLLLPVDKTDMRNLIDEFRWPSEFINQVPHISFVYGQEQVDFLRSRYKGMSNHPFFETMQYSEDPEQIRKWAPLLIEGREDQPVATG